MCKTSNLFENANMPMPVKSAHKMSFLGLVPTLGAPNSAIEARICLKLVLT